ncbi:MAG: Ig-like domain-containing protein [Bacteroides sp.]|nr:Ig-like domain-containing protein [Bacteroides sp.]MCM1379135.1 Ig-like domain-containing protein [Bacteroides sp.]MCM1445329.1 Ig-like domain-containing protein [Prevotella sp.]
MKKLKTLLCALLASGAVHTASALNVVVNVDDASRVTCQSPDGDNIQPEGNSFKFSCEEDDMYFFTCKDGYQFASIIDPDGDDCMYYEGEVFENYFWQMGYAFGISEGTYTVTTKEAAGGEVNTTFSVHVDNAAAVTMLNQKTHTEVTLVDGDNTLECDETGGFYQITKKNYESKDIYSVKVNGVAKTDSYGYYNISVMPGDVVDIQTEWPDADATITFTYNPKGKGCITNVKVDNVLVDDFDGESLTVKLGSTLSFEKTNNWSVTSCNLNGTTQSYFNYYSGVVKGDMEFSFVAEYDDPYITLNINIDNDNAVKTSYYSSTTYSDVEQILEAGDNEVTVEKNKTVYFKAIAPYGIKEILDLDLGSPLSVYAGQASAYVSGTKNYKITTFDEEKARTATAIFNIDNAENVTVRRVNDSYTFTNLQAGKNEIKFNPETETNFAVFAQTNVPLWEVKFNGEPVQDQSGYYYLTLTDGCTVDVTATIPDIDITATFDITDEDAAENLITGVKVDNQEIEFNGKTLNLKAGQQIALTFDNFYKIDSFKVGENEKPVASTSYTSSVLMADTKFTIAAHKLSTIKVNVIVDDPANISVGNGYNVYSGAYMFEGLQAGENEVEIPENNNGICWKINDGCELVSVKLNGVEENLQSNYNNSVTVKDGDEVEFTTYKIAYDKTAILWIDNREAADQYFSFGGNRSGDSKSVDGATGYTEFNFRDAMNPMSLSWYGQEAKVGKVYKNNELVNPDFEGSTSHTITVEDGDVIKVFLATEPVESKLSFDVEEGIEVSATTDRIVAVEDLSKELTVFNGTEVAFSVKGDGVVVKNGDTELTPDEDGNYVVTVNGDTALSIKKAAKGNLVLTLSETELTLEEGETATLGANYTADDDVTVEKKEFTSSDDAVATVSAEGIVTAVKAGEATITVTLTDNYGREFTATCKVTVTEKSGIIEIANGQLGSEVYDLQGRRVNKSGKGLYIINGKKTLVK